MSTTLMPCDLQLRAQKALAASPIHSLQRLKVEKREGFLIISGSVGSFYHKQLAQEAIRCVTCDIDLVNAISVVD